MKVALLSTLLVALAAPVAGQAAEFRTFTSKSGKTIEGRIVDYNPRSKMVKLEARDGRTASIRIGGLSAGDRTAVKKWSTGKTIGTPAHFKVTAKKVVLDKSREDNGATTTETKEMAYEVTLKNNTRQSIPPLTVKYGMFYRQQEWQARRENNETLSEYGEHKTKAIPPTGSATFTTDEISLERKKHNADWYSTRGTSDGSLRGLWLRVYLPDETEHACEFTEPASLKESVTWDP